MEFIEKGHSFGSGLIWATIIQEKQLDLKENVGKGSSPNGSMGVLHKSNPLKETQSSQRTTIAKICEEGKIDPNMSHSLDL